MPLLCRSCYALVEPGVILFGGAVCLVDRQKKRWTNRGRQCALGAQILQSTVHSVSDETSFTKIRLPEIAG
jgi:hypothetical protein